MEPLKDYFINLYEQKIDYDKDEFFRHFEKFIILLNSGRVRAAEPVDDRWKVHRWVKYGILLGFKHGDSKDFSLNSTFRYFDKHTYPLNPVQISDQVRIVPGGTTIRTGCYVAAGVVIMPPAYINVGAYVGANSMIDSHALVGSCAQVGERVHLSAASQIGGVLEPVGALPVIIENDVLVGGNCGIYEGTVISKGAVIGAGTILTRSIPVYDLVNEKIIRADQNNGLVIPENAVVIPGSRPVVKSEFAKKENIQSACALIVKYRDSKTDRTVALEEALR
ncbi:2,3,4,5-tetrahydropyridine-2,6-dicarboxylate N-succinyltransferase [candidate division KSB1 bacterium]|nr:2,3,4,5-tetrahydropyridine-2,6-dicarboxylate N-succinyltransferase [candidate division KSB1 bacterium]